MKISEGLKIGIINDKKLNEKMNFNKFAIVGARFIQFRLKQFGNHRPTVLAVNS